MFVYQTAYGSRQEAGKKDSQESRIAADLKSIFSYLLPPGAQLKIEPGGKAAVRGNTRGGAGEINSASDIKQVNATGWSISILNSSESESGIKMAGKPVWNRYTAGFTGFETPDSKVKVRVDGAEATLKKLNDINIQNTLDSGGKVEVLVDWGHPIFAATADGKYVNMGQNEDTFKVSKDKQGNTCVEYSGYAADFGKGGESGIYLMLTRQGESVELPGSPAKEDIANALASSRVNLPKEIVK